MPLYVVYYYTVRTKGEPYKHNMDKLARLFKQLLKLLIVTLTKKKASMPMGHLTTWHETERLGLSLCI